MSGIILSFDRPLTSLPAGSYALLGAKVPRDASVVTKLREAGAVILGKTNLSQWANFRSTRNTTSSGWSAVGGQVTAPYHPHQDPCGSSSGSGVAAALGLAVATLGTEVWKVSFSEPANIQRQMVAFYALVEPATLSASNLRLD